MIQILWVINWRNDEASNQNSCIQGWLLNWDLEAFDVVLEVY